jgi:hypothetical protein
MNISVLKAEDATGASEDAGDFSAASAKVFAAGPDFERRE